MLEAGAHSPSQRPGSMLPFDWLVMTQPFDSTENDAGAGIIELPKLEGPCGSPYAMLATDTCSKCGRADMCASNACESRWSGVRGKCDISDAGVSVLGVEQTRAMVPSGLQKLAIELPVMQFDMTRLDRRVRSNPSELVLDEAHDDIGGALYDVVAYSPCGMA